MFKASVVPLMILTACTTSGERIAPEGGTLAASSGTEAAGNVAFATSPDGTAIAFETVGNGPALVVVGGALSERKGARPLARTLMERFTVYTYDRRGRGDSGDTKPYAVEREIEDLGALIEQAGNASYVYAVSSGAALALQAAAPLGPTKVRKLAVYEPPYGQEAAEFNEQKGRVNQLVQTGEPGEAAAFFLSAIGMPPPVLAEMQRSPEWEGIEKIDFTLAYDYAVLGTGTVPDIVQQITVPTLVMDGENTLAFIHPAADRIAELIPNAQRKTIPGQTHQVAPEAVTPLLIEFFTD